MGWIITIIIIAVLCALVLFFPVRVLIDFAKNGETASFKLTVRLGFLKIKILPREKAKKEKKAKPAKKPKDTPKAEKKTMLEKIKSGIELYKRIAEDVKDVLSYTAQNAFRFEKIYIKLGYGTEDAAATGVLYGVISAVLYGLVGLVSNFSTVDKSEINITPNFTTPCFEAEGECIVKLRNVHIIVIISKIIKLLLKIRKESDKNGRTSNSRADGHSDEQY